MLLWIFVSGNAALVFAILTALIWVMHRGNIARLHRRHRAQNRKVVGGRAKKLIGR